MRNKEKEFKSVLGEKAASMEKRQRNRSREIVVDERKDGRAEGQRGAREGGGKEGND